MLRRQDAGPARRRRSCWIYISSEAASSHLLQDDELSRYAVLLVTFAAISIRRDIQHPEECRR